MSRMTDPDGHTPLFVGLARARFGLGMAASGLSAARKTAFDGRVPSPCKGGARLYKMDGMTRGATYASCGRKSPAVTEAVSKKTRTEEVLPEVRAAAETACAVLEVTCCVEDPGRDVRPVSDVALGSDLGPRFGSGFTVAAY